MTIQDQIKEYIASQPEPKRTDFERLHQHILQLLPESKLWYLDGRNEEGKVVTNPSIGYGVYTMRYVDGKSKDFYQIGISSNTAGISVYIMGIKDRDYLPNRYGKKLGKASVTGYCIKFKMLNDIDLDVLDEAIRDGIRQTT